MEIKLEQMARFGLIGRAIGYSFSRGYFRNKFKALRLEHTYENFDIPSKEELPKILADSTVLGFNVTIPYKQHIIPYLDRLDKHAAAIGAVNTVKREKDGTLTGYNTDYIGFRDSLLEIYDQDHLQDVGTSAFAKMPAALKTKVTEQNLDDPREISDQTSTGNETDFVEESAFSRKRTNANYRALILGTGGASKSVVYAFNQLKVSCQYISRKRSETALTYDDLTDALVNEHTFIVNCTPLGTYPEVAAAPDFPFEFVDNTHIAYDLIYNPAETTFLRLCAEQGATTSNGLRMLELQAEASWDIWNS